jgi:serine/threonine protein kinase
MSSPANQLEATVKKLRAVESHAEGEYLHEYEAVLEATNDVVRVITLPPDLTDNNAAIDAFSRVSGQWSNISTDQNVVSIVEREATPHPWIAIDKPHERTLDRVQSQLKPTELKTVVTQTAEILRTLGLYNAVHGSLCPDNILVSPDGDETDIQIRGFGLNHAVRTVVGDFKPTPYTAPELLDTSNQPTDRADVYGLGAITYFALTGQPPVDGANLEQTIPSGPTNPPSEYTDEIGPRLDDVVMQALSTQLGDRQTSAHTFKLAFLSAFDPEDFRLDSAAEENDDGEARVTDPQRPSEVVSYKNGSQPSSKTDDSADTDIIAEVGNVSPEELKIGVEATQLQCTPSEIKFINDGTVETEISHAAVTDIDTEISQAVDGFRRIGNAFLLPAILFGIFSLYSWTVTSSLIDGFRYIF